jgi:NADH-ubiquinone oxidoreductase chain 5
MYSFFNGKYFFDVIYNHYIINKALGVGLDTSKVLDRGLIEKVGPFGLTDSFYNTSRQIATLDSGIITSYALYIILGFISLTLLLFVPVLAGATVDNVGDLRLVLLFTTALVSAVLGAENLRFSDARTSNA